jgi:putative endonuclease
VSSPRQVAGRAVEEAAETHLATAGLRPVARNVTCRMGELDLVMRDGEALVFVEVRYRRSASHGSAAESVSRTKRARLVAAARYFLMRNPKLSNLPCRFDVVAVDGEGDARRVEWLRDAFRLDG